MDFRERIAVRQQAEHDQWAAHLAAMDAREHGKARQIERDIFGIKGREMSEEAKAYFARPDVIAKAKENAEEKKATRKREKALLIAKGIKPPRKQRADKGKKRGPRISSLAPAAGTIPS